MKTVNNWYHYFPQGTWQMCWTEIVLECHYLFLIWQHLLCKVWPNLWKSTHILVVLCILQAVVYSGQNQWWDTNTGQHQVGRVLNKTISNQESNDPDYHFEMPEGYKKDCINHCLLFSNFHTEERNPHYYFLILTL